jgi:hypothetical protein
LSSALSVHSAWSAGLFCADPAFEMVQFDWYLLALGAGPLRDPLE